MGIFPASHVHIREQLEDAERRLKELAEQAAPPAEQPAKPSYAPGPRNGRMEPLQEEDEEEPSSPQDGVTDLTGFGPNGGTPSKARNRASVASFQGSRLSYYGLGAGADAVDLRPPPPLPNLKCGDETMAGQVEPLVDEVACALREWAALLYTHLHRRDYALFESVRRHVDALHVGRKQLLANTLSIDETEELRKEMVSRLVKGNVEQGLEVIVRHPLWGGLVDVDVDGDIENKAWATVIRMCELVNCRLSRGDLGADYRSHRRHAGLSRLLGNRRRRPLYPSPTNTCLGPHRLAHHLAPPVQLDSPHRRPRPRI